MTLKQDFISALVSNNKTHPQLNVAILAQAIHETADFTSLLSVSHLNHWGLKWRPEMSSHAAPITIKVPSETEPVTFCHFNTLKNSVTGYFKFLSRAPYVGWEGHANEGSDFISFISPIWCPPSADPNYVAKVLKYFPYAASALDGIIPTVPPTSTKTRILLDPGHDLFKKPGARSNDGKVREEVLNVAAAKEMQKVLQAAGFVADIFDPQPDNLTAIGEKAWSYDAAISFHHNSYDGNKNPYHCIMVDPQAPKSWKTYASKMCVAMANSLKGTPAETQVFSGTNGTKGVYEAELSVLNRSAQDPDGKPPFHCLVEAYFLNGFSNEEECSRLSTKAAGAVAQFLISNSLPK